MGIEYEIVAACDVKRASWKFHEMNHGSNLRHFFDEIDSVVHRRGYCRVHARICDLKDEAAIDWVVGGTPCQPFTRFRERSDRTARTSTDPAAHPDWAITFEGLLGVIATWKPAFTLLEQVQGFDSHHPGHMESPMQTCCKKALKVCSSVRCIEMMANDWLDVKRDRFS
jgi:site-specific DNA-cytosine methylase